MLFRLVPVIPAIVAAVVLRHEGSPRPNLTTWKASKEAEAEASAAAAAREKKMAAVNKAMQLLESLKTQVLKEGEAEAATYNKFACFCQDTTSEKLASIKKGEDEKNELVSTIGKLTTRRDGLDGTIQSALDAIALAEKQMKDKTGERKKTLKLYETNAADLRAALEALAGAIKTLKSSRTPSLVQLQSVSETVRTAAMLADALGLNSRTSSSAMTFLLQQSEQPEVQMEDYKFHSNNIISTLEGLNEDFKQTKIGVDQDEVESVKNYDIFMQDQTHKKKMKNKELDQARKDKAQTVDSIAMASQQLTTVEADLMDNKEYTEKLSQMCRDKALTWDQRTRVRADELATLTQAIGIVGGAVKGNTSATTIRFVQQATSIRLAKSVAADAGAMDAIEAAAEEADASPAFVQVASEQHGRLRASLNRQLLVGAGDGRDAIVRVLQSQGQQLKSTLLTALASRIAADPFAKVKQLIQELIERLLQEAANEANQKGWCDKATADAKQKRDYAAEEIASLDGEMATLEASRDRLAEELDILSDEIQELYDSRNTTQTERSEEQAQNAATVEEAEEGLSALNMCIDLLDKFYKTVKKESVNISLVQGPSDDAPGAGFDIGEAYTGAQSEAGGILGMLDVMKSDFERTVSETQKAEAQAEQDHLEFLTETGKSLAEKVEAESQKDEQKRDIVGKLGEAKSELAQQVGLLDGFVRELLDLKPVCIDTGMSYQDRVARREEEIESLNKALCIFDNYAEYGPEGATGNC
jgi:hypothetical protein